MRRIFVVFICVLSQITLLGQNKDSLKMELSKATNETQKALLSLRIGILYLNADKFDSCAPYLGMAKKLGNDSVIMESEFQTGIAALWQHKAGDAIPYFIRAIDMTDKINLPARRTAMMYSLAYSYMDNGALDKGFDECQQGMQIAFGQHDLKLQEKFDLLLVKYYRIKGQLGLAVDNLTKCISLCDSLKDYTNMAFCYTKIAGINALQGDVNNALKYSLVADSIYKKTDDAFHVNYNYMDMSSYYAKLGLYDKGLEVSLKTLDFFSKDTEQFLVIYGNLAVIYDGLKDYAKAIQYFKLCRLYNDRFFHIPIANFDINNGLSQVYYKLKNYDSSIYYATVVPWDNDVTKADKGLLDQYAERTLLLTKDYIYKGEKDKATQFFNEYEICRDSMDAATKEDFRTDADAKFNIDEKNRQLKALATENELQKLKVQNDRITNIFLGSFLFLGVLVIVVVVVFYRRVVAQNKLLAEQKTILSEQKEKIDVQNLKLANEMTMKSKFMANVSHELRTPVTLISGILELIREEPGQNENKEKISVAYNSSRRLQKMVEEILDINTLENTGVKNNPKIIEVGPLLTRITSTFESFVKKENQSLQFKNNLAGPGYIKIDEGNFEKIINNLIYNSFKFNDKNGWIEVEARLGDKGRLAVTVSDSGRGIKPEDLGHVFERFYKGSEQGTESGFGIGLSLVKEFTELAGGSIEVRSETGRGTTFTLYFPLVAHSNEDVADADIELASVENWNALPVNQTVLIVEDNESMRYYLKNIFNGRVAIAEAVDGAEALKWLEHNNADLIITDLMMPEMDGRELVNQLKASTKYQNIPIIMLTAIADKESQLSMLRTGIDDYIVKPFSAHELRVRVYNLLNNYAERLKFNRQPVAPEELQDVAETTTDPEFLQKITTFVMARLDKTEVSVGDVARELAISDRQFYRLSKSMTGYTPAQLIKELRLQKAYELLSSGKVFKIDDVASRVGFDTPAYFAKQFFERFGKRPSDFY